MDSFLEIPLPEAKVTLLDSDSVKISDVEIMGIMGPNDQLLIAHAVALVDCGKKYILHGVLEGYEDAWLSADVPNDASSQFNAGVLGFQKKQKMDLDELVVTATKVKMVWKGDTIVYNADAFNLPKGSMLDDLIRQMPGVTMNDGGEIFVNGRKVDELLLGSKSFFRGKSEVLLKNLPYYTVKNVKVYDKQSDVSKAAGYDVDPKKYVMDVNLKQEYNSGIIANAEAGVGTTHRYLGRAFLLGYSDPFRFSLYGNINNVNESRHIGESGNWTPDKMPTSMLTTRSVAGEIGYMNKKIDETLNVDYSYTSNSIDFHQIRDLFLAGSSPRSVFQSESRDNSRLLKVSNKFKLYKPYIDFNFDFTHRKFNTRANSSTTQSDNGEMTNVITDLLREEGYENEIYATLQGFFSLSRKNRSILNYFLIFKHRVEGNDGMRHYEFIEPANHQINNANNYHNRATNEHIMLIYRPFNINGVGLTIDEQISFAQNKRHDYLYHPDSLALPSQKEALIAITDFANSYNSRYNSESYTTTLTLNKQRFLEPSETKKTPYPYNPWAVSIKISPTHESLFYHRGELDTHLTSNVLVVQPSFRLNIFPGNKYDRQIDFYITHYNATPSLFDCVDYRDDGTPLVVKLGNPNLKGSRTTETNVNFYSRGSFQRLFHTGASFKYMHRAVGQSVSYDPQTGTYTYRPENVRGNYVATLNIDYTQSLGSMHLWTVSNTADGNFNHNKDHTMLQGQTESNINTVNTLTLHDGVYVQFEKRGLSLRASGDVSWRHSMGKMVDFSKLNAVDFRYGLSAQYTIPVLNTTLSADGTIYSRRGYGSSSLNTNDFVLNASIAQPMFKGRLVARIEGYDLLHRLSQTRYEVNAQGRIETWYRSLPHYVMLHLVYNFNLGPKK